MNITVSIDEVSLTTVVGEVTGHDSDGYPYVKGEQTVGHLVADVLVERLVKDARYPGLAQQVTDIRKEIIREAIRPQVEEAVSTPFRKTNGFGEPAGGPVTLRQVILDETRKFLKAPADSYNRDKGTVLEQMVRAEVQAAFAAEIKDAVKQARESVAGEIGRQVGAAVQAAMKGR